MTPTNRTNFASFEWIDVCSPKHEQLEEIATEFNLDIYQIHDSLQTGHLPKFEKQKNYDFLILRAYTGEGGKRITNINELSNKIAFFYNDKKIITVHRANFTFLADISGEFDHSQQLLLHIINCMIKSFEEPSKLLSDKVDLFEHTIFLKDHGKISLKDLYFHKASTRISKKLLQISHNVINHIQVHEKYKPALEDIKDQLLSLTLTYEEVGDDSYNLLNTYLSINAQKSNDVTKLLTIFSAFFLPLTFIAGIYGMNFENMPELRWHFGYYATLGIMAGVALVIFFWFKRKRII